MTEGEQPKLSLPFYGWIQLFTGKMREAFEYHAKDKGRYLPELHQIEYYMNKLSVHQDKLLILSNKVLVEKTPEVFLQIQKELTNIANYCLLLARENAYQWAGGKLARDQVPQD